MDAQLNSISSNVRAASFSYYLSSAEENFVHNLADPVGNPPALASTLGTPYSISLGRTKAEVGEIQVFGAERYFNMKLGNNISGEHRIKRGNQVDHLQHTNPKCRPGTPSASSEASWSSQTALLPGMLRNPSQNKHKKVNGKGLFANLSCNGCSAKKSVCIDQNIARGGVRGREFRKESIDHKQKRGENFLARSQMSFAFPKLNSGMQNSTGKSQMEKERIKEEVPRESLEVFGSHKMKKKGDIAMNLERKLSMLTWDAIPKSQSLPTTSRSDGGSGIYEDHESDASSDLFEIHNISANGHPLFN